MSNCVEQLPQLFTTGNLTIISSHSVAASAGTRPTVSNSVEQLSQLFTTGC